MSFGRSMSWVPASAGITLSTVGGAANLQVWCVGCLVALLLAAVPGAAHAQYTDKPLGAPGFDLGPSARPSGNLPASGLLPGTPARPPGEFGASTYSPVNPLPNPTPAARPTPGIIRLDPPRDYQRAHGEMTEEQIRRFTEYCKTHRKLTRCKAFPSPDERKQKRDSDDDDE